MSYIFYLSFWNFVQPASGFWMKFFIKQRRRDYSGAHGGFSYRRGSRSLRGTFHESQFSKPKPKL